MIPFFSLRSHTAALKAEVMAAVERVIDAQSFILGPEVEAFERALAAYVGVREAVALNSGTTALHGALIAAGVGPGDEVVTVSHTWISTVWAVSYVGARPVLADIDPSTCGIDPADLARKVGPRTRAVIPVHLYGVPVDMDPVLDVAQRHGLVVIEDFAQSIGARHRGRATGSMGRINATSFYPSKNLGAFGEGGAVLTDDGELAARVRRLRDHAQHGRHNHVELGFNWRMDGLQGAVLRAKLAHLDAWNARRRAIADRYRAGLADAPGLSLLPEREGVEVVWHLYPVFHERRDELRARLEARGVGTGVHYPRPVHLQPAYAHLGLGAGALPHSERAAATELSLPMYPELVDDEVDAVVRAVQDVCHELR